MLASLQAVRRKVGAFIGGFEAGLASRRLKGFQPSRAHLNTLIAAAGPDITARARWLVRNNGYAANAIESWAGNVVGAGIKPSALIVEPTLKAQVQKLWLDWTDEADAEGFTDFYGLQRRAAREVFIAGEVFFRFRPRRPEDGLSVPLQLQMLPSEMLPLNRNETTPGGNLIRQGIEFDAIGRRVAYHFLRRHPGDMTDPGLAGEIVRIPAFEIVHVIDPVDAGQLRGISRFAAGIVKLFLLDQYDDAELDRKKVAAMHALFITTPAPTEPLDAAEGRDENDERTIDLQPGQITMLEPGEEVQTSTPADSGQTYEPFQYRTLLQVSAALGVPYAYLSNDMLKANYSNSRLALLEFRRRTEAYQHAVIVWQLCRQVWARWMDTAVLAGVLSPADYDRHRREYLACGWLPPKWDTAAHGTWKIEAWDGFTWTDLITGVALGGATIQTISFANTNAYIIYRMVQTAGATSSSPWVQEVEFKIAQGEALASAASAYANAGGSGDRQSSITVTTDISLAGGSIAALVDGTTNSGGCDFNGGQSGRHITFDFGVGAFKVIDEFKWYAGNASNHGTWLFQASNDDTSYDDLGTPFTLNGQAGGGSVTYSVPAYNRQGYRYYRLLQISGTTSGSPTNWEIEFKIADASVPPRYFVGDSGIVSDIADAVDIRGPIGPTGSQGNQGERGDTGDSGPASPAYAEKETLAPASNCFTSAELTQDSCLLALIGVSGSTDYVVTFSYSTDGSTFTSPVGIIAGAPDLFGDPIAAGTPVNAVISLVGLLAGYFLLAAGNAFGAVMSGLPGTQVRKLRIGVDGPSSPTISGSVKLLTPGGV